MNCVLFWGDVCIDENTLVDQKVRGPGGASLFGSKIMRQLGGNPVVIAPRGSDYDDRWLQETRIFPEKPVGEKTLIYENRYAEMGNRTLYGYNLDAARFVDPGEVPLTIIQNSSAIIVCPIDNNVSRVSLLKLQKLLSQQKLICFPQGFFRRYEPDGRVYQGEWENAEEIIKLLDIVILSQEDGADIDAKTFAWSKQKPLVVVTRAEQGCSVFEKGERSDFPAFPVDEIIDPVGAGDVFGSAFVYKYLETKDIKKAAVFANAAGALSLQFHATDMNITKEAIENIIQKNEKR